MVPDCPPEAVRPKEQEDLGREAAEAPRTKEEINKEYILIENGNMRRIQTNVVYEIE